MNTGKVIRFALLALPVGLMLLGGIAVVVTHLSPDSLFSSKDEFQDERQEVAVLNRRQINEADLRIYVETLATKIGERHLGKPGSLEKTALWLESTLGPSNAGYLMKRQKYDVDGTEVWNVIAELRGTSRPKEIVVVGAHYDSVPDCPAANDNGSGVAALVALAREFAGDAQARTIQFVAFVNEEPPYFQTEKMGSLVFAKRAKSDDLKITSMLSLETIGFYSDEEGSQKYPPGLEKQFPPTGNFIAFVGHEQSRDLAESARASFMKSSPIPAMAGGFPESMQGIGWSDHWSFWQVGYSAIMVTDTAPYRYPHYHKPTDTAEKLDYEKMTSVVKGLKTVVESLANPE